MPKRTTLALAALLIISIFCFGQELPKGKSASHVQIPGTNVFMIPPPAFLPSNNFKGFQKSNDPTSMIMIMEIPGSYSEVTKGFNAEMLKARGMELKTTREIKVADYNGLLLELNQAANGLIFSKQILVYGDNKSSTLINGVYPTDSSRLAEEIKNSILSTFVDSKLKSNPRDALTYSLNENEGSLKFHSVIGNGMLFNRDLKTPTESADKATLIAEKSFAKVDIKDKKLFCISRVKKYPTDYSIIPGKGITEIEIDNLQGFELFAKSNSDVDEELYQVILFDNNGGYYLFVGTYLTGSENAVSDIKRAIATFKRKK